MQFNCVAGKIRNIMTCLLDGIFKRPDALVSCNIIFRYFDNSPASRSLAKGEEHLTFEDFFYVDIVLRTDDCVSKEELDFEHVICEKMIIDESSDISRGMTSPIHCYINTLLNPHFDCFPDWTTAEPLDSQLVSIFDAKHFLHFMDKKELIKILPFIFPLIILAGL